MIEPCLYCGAEIVVTYAMDLKSSCFSPIVDHCECQNCGAAVLPHNIERHNRLSRIVRAAERMAGFTEDQMEDYDKFMAYQQACRDVVEAVEGG